jgi:hypothetical protein
MNSNQIPGGTGDDPMGIHEREGRAEVPDIVWR